MTRKFQFSEDLTCLVQRLAMQCVTMQCGCPHIHLRIVSAWRSETVCSVAAWAAEYTLLKYLNPGTGRSLSTLSSIVPHLTHFYSLAIHPSNRQSLRTTPSQNTSTMIVTMVSNCCLSLAIPNALHPFQTSSALRTSSFPNVVFLSKPSAQCNCLWTSLTMVKRTQKYTQRHGVIHQHKAQGQLHKLR